ncbi:MAG: hypothetical protein ACPGTP_06575 [Bacteroidia bacterium]
MGLIARLENIEFHVKQLKKRCEILENENEQLQILNDTLERKLETKTQEILNLVETNKISKLAQSASSSSDNSELKKEIDQIIKEIDRCLTLVKQ